MIYPYELENGKNYPSAKKISQLIIPRTTGSGIYVKPKIQEGGDGCKNDWDYSSLMFFSTPFRFHPGCISTTLTLPGFCYIRVIRWYFWT